MLTLIDKLNNLLKSDPFFLDENGDIIKEKIKSSAISLDKHLLNILVSDKELKEAFFFY